MHTPSNPLKKKLSVHKISYAKKYNIMLNMDSDFSLRCKRHHDIKAICTKCEAYNFSLLFYGHVWFFLFQRNTIQCLKN